MSVNVNSSMACTVAEVLEANPHSAVAGQRTVTHTAFNSSHALSASTTPPVTKVAAFKAALVAGAKTIDLTALVGTNGATVDGTGLKVQVIKVKNLGTNPLTIAVGATNGYDLAGGAFSAQLKAGMELMLFGNDQTPDVASGEKTLDLTGTGTEESEWIVVLG